MLLSHATSRWFGKKGLLLASERLLDYIVRHFDCATERAWRATSVPICRGSLTIDAVTWNIVLMSCNICLTTDFLHGDRILLCNSGSNGFNLNLRVQEKARVF